MTSWQMQQAMQKAPLCLDVDSQGPVASYKSLAEQLCSLMESLERQLSYVAAIGLSCLCSIASAAHTISACLPLLLRMLNLQY